MSKHESDPRHAPRPPGSEREEAAMPPYTAPDAAAPGGSPVEEARRRHERSLMAIDGVTGVAVGRTPTGDDAIVVYLRHRAAGQAVPATLDGHPVIVRVTGEIDAYGGQGRDR